MKKYQKLKFAAVSLRKQGKSYQNIQKKLDVPKSTLNYWLSDINLSKTQKEKLHKNWTNALIKARKKASLVHRQAKQKRIKNIKTNAKHFINSLTLNKKSLELFLSGLYLGDGCKVENRLALGSSNPQILLTFITLLRKLYNVKESKLKAVVSARADQNTKSLVKYWSKLLKIPITRFHKSQVDKRTQNTPTRLGYKGVCSVIYCDTSLQRRVLAISDQMLQYINNLDKLES